MTRISGRQTAKKKPVKATVSPGLLSECLRLCHLKTYGVQLKHYLGEVYSGKCLHLKKKKSQFINTTFHVKKLLKEEKTKFKICIISEIIKIKVDINETGNTKTTEKSVKPKVGFLKKGKKIDNLS